MRRIILLLFPLLFSSQYVFSDFEDFLIDVLTYPEQRTAQLQEECEAAINKLDVNDPDDRQALKSGNFYRSQLKSRVDELKELEADKTVKAVHAMYNEKRDAAINYGTTTAKTTPPAVDKHISYGYKNITIKLKRKEADLAASNICPSVASKATWEQSFLFQCDEFMGTPANIDIRYRSAKGSKQVVQRVELQFNSGNLNLYNELLGALSQQYQADFQPPTQVWDKYKDNKLNTVIHSFHDNRIAVMIQRRAGEEMIYVVYMENSQPIKNDVYFLQNTLQLQGVQTGQTRASDF